MSIRCVVTGHSESGASVVLNDGPAESVTVALLPGVEFFRLWGSDSVPILPSSGTSPSQHNYFPPKGGFRFMFCTIPPWTEGPQESNNTNSLISELQEKLPGLAEVFGSGNSGMHMSDTVDFVVVLAGEVWLELDNKVEVRLRAGDCVIQNGTQHAWHNRSSEKCVVAVTLVGAERSSESHRPEPAI